MAIFPYKQAEDLPPEDRDVIASGRNLHKIMVYSPGTARASQTCGGHIRRKMTLDPRLRELAILMVAQTAGSGYEYAQHLKIAEDFGVPEADLAGIAAEAAGKPTHYDALTRAVLHAAREMTLNEAASPATMKGLAELLSPEHVIDLVFTIAFYVGFGRVTGSLGIEVEPDRQSYLERFPMHRHEA